MATKKQSAKKGKPVGLLIGSSRFRKVSAVEGIHFSSKMKGSAAAEKSNARTAEERRKAIIAAYRKA